MPAPFVRRARADAKHRNEKGASLEASVHSIPMATLQRIRRRRRSAYSSGVTKFENLQLAMLDLEENNPAFAPVAAIPFDARSLAFDGTAWWTSRREASEIVSFEA